MHEVDQTTEQMVRSVWRTPRTGCGWTRCRWTRARSPPPTCTTRLDGVIRDRAATARRGARRLRLGDRARVISADSPRFLGFIPAAPTKASLLFDMLVSCASIQGISWLEASGAVAAENTVLRLLADEAGLPATAGGCSCPAGRRATCRRSRWPARPPRAARVTRRAGRRLRVVVGTGRALLDRQHAAPAGDGRPGGRHPRPPADRETRAGRDRRRPGRSARGRGGLHRGNHQRRHRRRPGRRRRVARERGWWFHVDGAYGGSGIFAGRSGRSTTASSRRTRSSSTRTSGCSRRSTAARCCTATRSWPGRRTPRTRPTSTSSTLPTASGTRPTTPTTSPGGPGLPLWFSLAVNGVEAYREAIEAAVRLARETAELIKAAPQLELIREPDLGVVLFRRIGWEPADYDSVGAGAARRRGRVHPAEQVGGRDGRPVRLPAPAHHDGAGPGDPRPDADLTARSACGDPSRRCCGMLPPAMRRLESKAAVGASPALR